MVWAHWEFYALLVIYSNDNVNRAHHRNLEVLLETIITLIQSVYLPYPSQSAMFYSDKLTNKGMLHLLVINSLNKPEGLSAYESYKFLFYFFSSATTLP